MFSPPPLIVFMLSFISGFLMAWMGLLLSNIKPKLTGLCIIGACYGIFAVIVRSIFSVGPDIAFLLQILLLAVMVMWIANLGLLKALVATIIGTIILALGEVVFTQLIFQGLGLNVQNINNPFMFLLLPLPQIVLGGAIIFFCLRLNLHLFNFQKVKFEDLRTAEGKRKYTTVGLILILLLVILVQLDFSMVVISKEFALFKSVPLSTFGSISTSIILLGIITMVFLIMRLVELTEKEGQYHLQAVYIDTLDELYTAIRSERHDIINHLQTIYGFNKLGYVDEVQQYLDELLGGHILSNDFIITGTPGLTALLYIKSGIARTNDIQFEIKVDQPITDLSASSYEINNILGNLINNAFDAVIPLHSSQRIVRLYIGADDNNYIFKVANYSQVDVQTIKNMMKKGVSSKKGDHSGLGLYICQQLIKKYNGHMEVSSNNNMIEFAVYLPKVRAKEELRESVSSKAGTFAG